MIHPSYQELIATINEGQDLDEAPVVSSRYSLVLATSKRARQIIGGAEPLVKVKKGMKPLSIAVEEMYKGEVTILPESEVDQFCHNPSFPVPSEVFFRKYIYPYGFIIIHSESLVKSFFLYYNENTRISNKGDIFYGF
jgi:DNA-directed RNA polymerase subunit omega